MTLLNADDMMAGTAELLPHRLAQPALRETDWGAEWKQLRACRKTNDSPEHWDHRAPTFGSSRAPSPYVTRFVELLDLQPNDCAFDMGCGNGAIAIPLAKAGHHVVARDYSSGMLAGLTAEATEAGVIENIDAAQMSWEDDWEHYGIMPKSVDVAFASRSIIVTDLADALRKLSSVARRHVCVTASSGYTPKISPTVLGGFGLPVKKTYDDVYIINILYQMDYFPEVTYIVSDRTYHFETFENAQEHFCKLIAQMEDLFSAEEIAAAKSKVRPWVEEHTQQNELAGQLNHHGEIEGAYKIVVPNDIRWTFIKWEV